MPCDEGIDSGDGSTGDDDDEVATVIVERRIVSCIVRRCNIRNVIALLELDGSTTGLMVLWMLLDDMDEIV